MLLADMDNVPWSAFVIPIVTGVITTVATTIGLLFVTARLSGWCWLGRAYPAQDTTGATRFRFRSCSFRRANYGACLTFTVDRDYLHLAMMLPFRFGHAPISIPWGDIDAVEDRGPVFLRFFRLIELRFAREPEIPILVTKGLWQKLIQAARELGANVGVDEKLPS